MSKIGASSEEFSGVSSTLTSSLTVSTGLAVATTSLEGSFKTSRSPAAYLKE